MVVVLVEVDVELVEVVLTDVDVLLVDVVKEAVVDVLELVELVEVDCEVLVDWEVVL